MMVLVLIEIADAFIDRKNNSMQVQRKLNDATNNIENVLSDYCVRLET